LFALAFVAQYLIDQRAALALPLALVAALGFGWATRALPLPGGSVEAGAPWAASAVRWRVLGSGVLLAGCGAALLGPNTFALLGTAAWVAGIACCLVACWDGAPVGQRLGRWARQLRRSGSLSVGWHALVLAAIIAFAAWLRFYRLADLPAEPAPDIPLKLMIVRGILDGERPIFSTVYPGRETGFFYLVALYAAAFGADQYALKLVSALLSLATVLLVYLAGMRCVGRGAGLWAAALVALAPWHIIISRIGYRGVLVPLLVALLLVALVQALTRNTRRDWLLVGLVVGLGCYSYTAFQATIPALLLIWLGGLPERFSASRAQPGWARCWSLLGPGWLLAALVAILCILPLARFALADWNSFFFRAGTRVTGREAPLPDDLLGTLAANIGASLGMFNLRGDGAAILNVPGRRTLGFVSGALFLLGVGVLATRLRERRFALLAVFLVVMQLPSALALAFPNEVPAALRASGALVPAYLLAALPLPLLAAAIASGWRGHLLLGSAQTLRVPLRAVGYGILTLVAVLLLAAEARATYRTYFVEYAAAQPYANYSLNRAIAAAIDDYGGEGQVMLRVWPFWSDENAIRATLRRYPPERYREVYAEQFTAELLKQTPPPAMFILHPDDRASQELLRATYARGALVARRDNTGRIAFYTFYAAP
jgi:4-amino-4-deoxy-L-arabinose transferase-like glycosyltransferase